MFYNVRILILNSGLSSFYSKGENLCLINRNFAVNAGKKLKELIGTLIPAADFANFVKPNLRFTNYYRALSVVGGILFGILGVGNLLAKTGDSVKDVPKQLSSTSLNINKSSANQAVEPQILSNQNVQSLAQMPPNTDSRNEIASGLLRSIERRSWKSRRMICASTSFIIAAHKQKKVRLVRVRVKGGGRCWQHLGQPAMLPQEKLLVSR